MLQLLMKGAASVKQGLTPSGVTQECSASVVLL
jgi:hypothetical protein